jgi:uncharacterized membrane protein
VTVMKRSMMRALPAAVAVAGMIATPLMRPRGRARRALSGVVVGGLFATTASAAAGRWGTPRAATAATTVGAATTLIEHVGTSTGFPFGSYAYSGMLRPTVVGVPVAVPLAWFAMAVPAREAARSALGSRSTVASRIALGAVALTAWDLFLDPQMVAEGYWRWARAGRYRGIPISNFAGWLLTAAGVMAVLEVVLPPNQAADPLLVAEYGGVAVMQTLGFARFFGDRTVALVGGVGMLPLAGVAARGLVGRGRHHDG